MLAIKQSKVNQMEEDYISEGLYNFDLFGKPGSKAKLIVPKFDIRT